MVSCSALECQVNNSDFGKYKKHRPSAAAVFQTIELAGFVSWKELWAALRGGPPGDAEELQGNIETACAARAVSKTEHE
jgi:hypothetical protein